MQFLYSPTAETLPMTVPLNVHSIKTKMLPPYDPDQHAAEGSRSRSRERALPDSQRIQSASLGAAPDCIVSIDERGRIVDFNQAAEATFGQARERVIGSNLASIIMPPEWQERYRHSVERFLSGGDTGLLKRRIEVEAMRGDGSRFPAEIVVVPIRIDGSQLFTAFIRNVEELRRQQAALKESAMRFRQLIDLAPEAILVVRDNDFILANQAAARMLGVPSAERLVGRSVYSFIHPDHRLAFLGVHSDLHLGAHALPSGEQVWLRANGEMFHAELSSSRVVYDGDPAIQVIVRDVTARKRAEQFQAGQTHILNLIAAGTELPAILEQIAAFADGQTDRFAAAIMLARSDASLACAMTLNLPDAYFAALGAMAIGPSEASCGTAAARAEPVVVTDIAHDPLWLRQRATAMSHGLRACTSWPIVSRDGKVLGTMAFYANDVAHPDEQDMALGEACARLAALAIDSRATEERIRHLAHHDGLTSLPNRFRFEEHLAAALRAGQRHGRRFAVFFIDLDKFKDINDTWGHDAGDLVLREIASRLRRCLRQTDCLARMGGDEFYALIDELQSREDAAEVADKLLEAAARPIDIAGTEVCLSASIGVALFPEHGSSPEALLRHADAAMYAIKKDGRNGFRFFAPARPERTGTVIDLHAYKGE